MAALILADDGNYQLRFVRRRYVAGCHVFTREQAVAHWKKRAAGMCSFGCCPTGAKEVDMKRARLFLKAIKKHAAEQSQ